MDYLGHLIKELRKHAGTDLPDETIAGICEALRKTEAANAKEELRL